MSAESASKMIARVKIDAVCQKIGDEEMEKEVMAQLSGLSVSRWNPFFADVNVAGVSQGYGYQ